MSESSLEDPAYLLIILAVILLIGAIISGIFVDNPTVNCADPKNAQVCSALSDMAFSCPTGHAIETTLYEDENGTLTMVTRDLGG